MYTDHPFYGSRRIAFELKMSRKRVQRLMRLMGIAALGPKPRTSKPAAGHKVFPYLLRGVSIERPNQVWACVIFPYSLPAGATISLGVRSAYRNRQRSPFYPLASWRWAREASSAVLAPSDRNTITRAHTREICRTTACRRSTLALAGRRCGIGPSEVPSPGRGRRELVRRAQQTESRVASARQWSLKKSFTRALSAPRQGPTLTRWWRDQGRDGRQEVSRGRGVAPRGSERGLSGASLLIERRPSGLEECECGSRSS